MAYYGYRARRTYAAAHRISANRSTATIYATETGEGIRSQTCSGAAQGLTQVVEVRPRKDGTPLFLVQSETFSDRYYGLYRQADGSFFFSGDAKLAAKYIAKVEAFEASQWQAVA